MKVLLACGGTGGHFYPGYALGRELIRRGHEVLFVVRTADPAASRLLEEDLPFAELPLRGMPRGLSGWPSFAAGLASSLRLCRNMTRSWRPDAVVGMGGYLTFPAAAAAAWRGVPVVLHDSNALPGLANRLCARWARACAVGLPQERPCPRRTALTGTPIREELWRRGDPARARAALGLDPALPAFLAFGGSQGASAINRLAPAAFARLPRGSVQVLHLSGPKEEAEVREAYRSRGVRAEVRPFLAGMADAYAAADAVLCRSGAGTLAELAAQAKPAVLVPYPSAAAGHQEANARVFERAGAAILAPQRTLTPESLAGLLEGLLPPAGAGRLAAMSAAYAALGLPSPERSVHALADLVEEAARPGASR